MTKKTRTSPRAQGNKGGMRTKGHRRSDALQSSSRETATTMETSQNDDTDLRSHLSLAVMSSSDDVSSLGETTTTQLSLQSSRRKPKDDYNSRNNTDGESEEEVSGGRTSGNDCRRRRLQQQQQQQTASNHHRRWQLGGDKKAAHSEAPVRPKRSDDDNPLLVVGVAEATSGTPPIASNAIIASALASSFPATSGSEGIQRRQRSVSASEHPFPIAPSRSFGGTSEAIAREVLRCQSMSSPPVRPTRTRDDSNSNLTIKSDTDDDDDDGIDNDETEKDEFDPDMFARLLQGQQVIGGKLALGVMMVNPPPASSTSLSTTNAHHQHDDHIRNNNNTNNSNSGPPKKPRRRSDADAFLYTFQQRQRKEALLRHTKHGTPCSTTATNTTAPTAATSSPAAGDHTMIINHSTHGASHRDCPHHCHSTRDNFSSSISPRPPSLPSRSIDHLESGHRIALPRDLDDDDDDAPSFPSVPLVSDPTTYQSEEQDEGQQNAHGQLGSLHNEMSSSSRMDLEHGNEVDDCHGKEPRSKEQMKKEYAEEREEKDDEEEEEEAVEEEIIEEDSTDISGPASIKEYDPDLFERLLHGDDASPSSAADYNLQTAPSHMISSFSMMEPPPSPPALSARVSSSQTTFCLTYNRFDNSIPCTSPEHMEGAMKSSHPPMRPRRSFDEGMAAFGDQGAVSLAAAAAAACRDNAQSGDMFLEDGPTSSSRPICIVGGKRRYSRRQSRRSTLPLSLSQISDPDDVAAREESDPTREAQLLSMSTSGEEAIGEIPDARDEYDQTFIQGHEPNSSLPGKETSSDSSYIRILPLPRHRRLVRRFTMPNKTRTSSPLTKKPRVHRSLSCRSSDESINSPAA